MRQIIIKDRCHNLMMMWRVHFFGLFQNEMEGMRLFRMVGISLQKKKTILKAEWKHTFLDLLFLYSLMETWYQGLLPVFAMCWARKIPFFVHRAQNVSLPNRFLFVENIRQMVFMFLVQTNKNNKEICACLSSICFSVLQISFCVCVFTICLATWCSEIMKVMKFHL